MALSKTKAEQILKALLARLATARGALDAAAVVVGSAELRIGIVLSEVKETLASSDNTPSFKDWLAKNYAGRSYETLNRWANAGTIARTLGYSDVSEDLPPIYEVQPLYEVLKATEKDLGREKAEEAVRTMNETARSRKTGSVSENVTKAVARRLNKPVAPAAPPKDVDKPGNDSPAADAPEGGAEVPAIDTAAVSALRTEVNSRWNKRAAYKVNEDLASGSRVPPALLNECRRETLAWVLEHFSQNSVREMLAAVSS